LSGSQPKAPGSAGGYLLEGRLIAAQVLPTLASVDEDDEADASDGAEAQA